MSPRRVGAVAHNELRILLKDPGGLTAFTLLPLVLIALFRPLMALALHDAGHQGANGAEFIVPAACLMSGYYTAFDVATSITREFDWRTWERWRIAGASTAELALAKVIVPVGVNVIRTTFVFGVAWLALGLQIPTSSLPMLGLVMTLTALAFASYGFVLVAISKNSAQINTYSTLSQALMTSVGGALVPLALLPAWMRAVSIVLPTHWSMQAFLHITLRDKPATAAALPGLIALVSFAGLFLALSSRALRLDDRGARWK